MNENTLTVRNQNPIEVVSVSDVGNVRSSNQDSYCSLLTPNTARGVSGVFAVADGMGGHAAGEVASQTAIKLIVTHLGRQGVDFVQLAKQAQSISNVLKQVAESVNREIFNLSRRPEFRGMGTTLTLAALSSGHMTLANVGDSRAYRKRGDVLEQLTVDDTWVQEEVARGSISAEAARTHPRRNILTRALGLYRNVPIKITQHSIQDGDLLLFCSDGLTESIDDAEISSLLNKNIGRSANNLMRKALRAGGKDNVTILLAHITNTAFDPLSKDPLSSDETIAVGDLNKNRGRLSGSTLTRVMNGARKLLPAWIKGGN